MLFDKLRKPNPALAVKNGNVSSVSKMHAFIMIAIGLFLSLKEGIVNHNTTITNALVHVVLVYAVAYFLIFRKKKPTPKASSDERFDTDNVAIMPDLPIGSFAKRSPATTPVFKPLPGTSINRLKADPVVRERKLPTDGRIKPGWFS